MKTADQVRREIQVLLGVTPDGDIGQDTEAAWAMLKAAPGIWVPSVKTVMDPPEKRVVHHVIASSFADSADIIAFNRCKRQGKSDQDCFKVGDNGIGKWGDSTTTSVPMCALPREDWEQFGQSARGKKVLVKSGGLEVICELRDTMPWKRNVKNGAGIDLNEAAWKVLGRKPPVMAPATWQWL